MLKEATAKELPTEQAIFNEAWSMIKAYHYIEAWGNDKEWETCIARACKLYETGKGTPELEKLAQGVTMAVMRYLECISKDKGDKEACIKKRYEEMEREEALKKSLNKI